VRWKAFSKVLPLNFFASGSPLSQTASRCAVKGISVLDSYIGYMSRSIHKYTAHPSPKFYRGQEVRNLASIFEHSRL